MYLYLLVLSEASCRSTNGARIEGTEAAAAVAAAASTGDTGQTGVGSPKWESFAAAAAAAHADGSKIVFFDVKRSQRLKNRTPASTAKATTTAEIAAPNTGAGAEEIATAAGSTAAGLKIAGAATATTTTLWRSSPDGADTSQATFLLSRLRQDEHEQQQQQRRQQECSDIEDIAAAAGSIPSSPCSSNSRNVGGLELKYMGPLLARKHWFLSATDFSSQVWCDRQTELLIRTDTKRRITTAMRQGKLLLMLRTLLLASLRCC